MGREEFERLGFVRVLAELPAERVVVAVGLLLVAQVLRFVGIVAVTIAALVAFSEGVIKFQDPTVLRRAFGLVAGLTRCAALGVIVLINAADAAVLSAVEPGRGDAAWC